MTDNAELVHIRYNGIIFDARVDLMPDDEEVALFYDDCDVTELMPMLYLIHQEHIKHMAIKAAIKQRAEKAADNKWSDERE